MQHKRDHFLKVFLFLFFIEYKSLYLKTITEFDLFSHNAVFQISVIEKWIPAAVTKADTL
jgi:hypothetical protein